MTSWYPAKLLSVVSLGSRASHVRILGSPQLSWGPGQYVALKGPEAGADLSYYSIASAPDGERPGEFELVVGPDSTRFFQGKGSARELLMAPPAGGLDPARLRTEPRLVLIGMGTGVAPLRATIQWAAGAGLQTGITLLVGARSVAQSLFDDEFSANPRLDYRPVLSQPEAHWAGRVGRVQEHLEGLPSSDALYYVCGSSAMAGAVSAALLAKGVRRDNMVCEGF